MKKRVNKIKKLKRHTFPFGFLRTLCSCWHRRRFGWWGSRRGTWRCHFRVWFPRGWFGTCLHRDRGSKRHQFMRQSPSLQFRSRRILRLTFAVFLLKGYFVVCYLIFIRLKLVYLGNQIWSNIKILLYNWLYSSNH